MRVTFINRWTKTIKEARPANLTTTNKWEKMAVFMLETLTLSKTLKSSRDDFNALDNVV